MIFLTLPISHLKSLLGCLSIHSPNDIPYLNYVKFIPPDSRANVILSFFSIQQKSLQLCEAYFSNKYFLIFKTVRAQTEMATIVKQK